MSTVSTYFHKWKRAESEKFLSEVLESLLQHIPCKIVRTSLKWAYSHDYLDEYPNWSETLYDRIGLNGIRAYRQILALRQKSDDWSKPGVSRSDAAWEKYCGSEIRCGLQNRRMASIGLFLRTMREDERCVIHNLPELIADVLGDTPLLEELPCRFGPGANVSCRGKTSARYKLSAPLGVSQEGATWVNQLASLFPRYFENREIFIEAAEMAEVPKTAGTNRTIEFQPLLNTFVQLGIGSIMKRRLLRFGINLFDQSLNKTDARDSSIHGRRSTIDFEGASDSLSVRAVQYALSRSDGWFDLLAAWRCGDTVARGFRFNSEKFSAMGNGYTFELESLIFWALGKCVVRHLGLRDQKVSIYGDDLIISTEALPLLTRCCQLLGFRINSNKSFSSGRFRESCGGDYVLGHDIRPFYIRGRLTTASAVAFANFLYTRWNFLDVRQIVCRYIPEDVPFGPPGLGDGHLVTEDPSLWTRQRVTRNGYSGWKQATILSKPRKDSVKYGLLAGDHLLPLYPLYTREWAVSDDLVREPYPYWSLRGTLGSKKRHIYILG